MLLGCALAAALLGACTNATPPAAEQVPASEPATTLRAATVENEPPTAAAKQAAPLPPTKPVRRSQATVRGGGEDEVSPWSFHADDRRVKLVVLAGSIGAWPREPYARRIERACSQVEVKNLSKVGYGAQALKARFREAVLSNQPVRRAQKQHPEHEYWLAFGGGLNSVGDPAGTNRQIRDLFFLAHQNGFQVLGLTLTPWGHDGDKQRWAGVNGWRTWRNTEQIVNFVLGRLSPRAALGTDPREQIDQWDPRELADIRVSLWDSALRDEAAPLRQEAQLRKALERNAHYHTYLSAVAPEGREGALAEQLRIAQEVPRWFLSREFRSFDAIHPNDEGHRVIAEEICKQAPASWGCDCDMVVL